MQIHVWSPAGELLVLKDMDSWDPVTRLQSCIAREACIPTERQRLSFGGRYLEGSRVLVEYGIHQQCQNIITIELEEIDVPCAHTAHKMLMLGDTLETDSSKIDYSQHLDRSQFLSQETSEISTCAPSECTSDAGDSDACGVSVLTSAACANAQASGDAFVDANSAHITYLLMRHRRLEAAGLGVRALIGDGLCS